MYVPADPGCIQLETADVAMNKLLYRREKGDSTKAVQDLDAGLLDETMFRIPGKRSYENVWAPAEVGAGTGFLSLRPPSGVPGCLRPWLDAGGSFHCLTGFLLQPTLACSTTWKTAACSESLRPTPAW